MRTRKATTTTNELFRRMAMSFQDRRDERSKKEGRRIRLRLLAAVDCLAALK
jgi:hypothetical protein